MKNKEKFDELWDKTTSMVLYQLKSRKNPSQKEIVDFFHQNVINGLWLTSSLPNQYSAWLHESYDDSPENIDTFSAVINSFCPHHGLNLLSWQPIAIIIVLLISLVLFFLGLPGLIIGLTLLVADVFVGYLYFQHDMKKCTQDDVENEMRRIKEDITLKIK